MTGRQGSDSGPSRNDNSFTMANMAGALNEVTSYSQPPSTSEYSMNRPDAQAMDMSPSPTRVSSGNIRFGDADNHGNWTGSRTSRNDNSFTMANMAGALNEVTSQSQPPSTSEYSMNGPDAQAMDISPSHTRVGSGKIRFGDADNDGNWTGSSSVDSNVSPFANIRPLKRETGGGSGKIRFGDADKDGHWIRSYSVDSHLSPVFNIPPLKREDAETKVDSKCGCDCTDNCCDESYAYRPPRIGLVPDVTPAFLRTESGENMLNPPTMWNVPIPTELKESLPGPIEIKESLPIPSESMERIPTDPKEFISNHIEPQESTEPVNSFKIRWVTEGYGKVPNRYPIVMQNHNGPCPLIAVANCLILQGRIIIPRNIGNSGEIDETALMSLIFNHLMEQVRGSTESGGTEDREALDRCLVHVQSLTKGLNINIKFDRITSFEETKMRGFFSLADVKMLHGWVVDPQDVKLYEVIQGKSYDEVSEIAFEDSARGRLLSAFLEQTRSQLTVIGLHSIYQELADGESAVFFRNNHFSTITKRKGGVYQVVTDIGYLDHQEYVYETVTTLDGDSMFCNANYETASFKKDDAADGQRQSRVAQRHNLERPHPPRDLPETTTSYPVSPSHQRRPASSKCVVS